MRRVRSRRSRPRRSRGDYRIGKGRPPAQSRWKPGQSGNPNGRPKGAKNAATMAKAALSRKVVATVNGKKIKMSVADIAYRRLGDKAMSGDQKALAFLLTLANDGDPADMKFNESTTTVQQDLEIIADYFQRHQKGKNHEESEGR